jgi:hypothetical protein
MDTDLNGREVAWAAVRLDYEAGEMTIFEIVRHYQLRLVQLETRARKNKWVRQCGPEADRRILVFKLFSLLERQMDLVEAAMERGDRAEKATLGELVRGLEKVIELQKADKSVGSGVESAEMARIRRQLADRINAITKR